MPVDPLLIGALGITDPIEIQQLAQQPADIPPGTGPTAASGSQPMQDALAQLQGVFNEYDVPSLSSWAWDELINGKSMDQITIEMHDQPAYKQRYPYEDAMRAAGLGTLSPADMLKTERDYKAVQQSFGITPSTNPADYVKLFTGQVSASEFHDRLNLYNKLRTTYSPYIKQQFETNAGIGDVSDQDLYKLLSGTDTSVAQRYADATGTPMHIPSFADIQTAEQKALQANAAIFSGGGGEEFKINPQDVTAAREQAI